MKLQQEAASATYASKFFMTPALLQNTWRISIFPVFSNTYASSATNLLIEEINCISMFPNYINLEKIYFCSFKCSV